MPSEADKSLRRCFIRIKLSFFNLPWEQKLVSELLEANIITSEQANRILCEDIPSSFKKRDRVDRFFSALLQQNSYKAFIQFLTNIQLEGRDLGEIEGLSRFCKDLKFEVGKYLSLVYIYSDLEKQMMKLRSHSNTDNASNLNREESDNSNIQENNSTKGSGATAVANPSSSVTENNIVMTSESSKNTEIQPETEELPSVTVPASDLRVTEPSIRPDSLGIDRREQTEREESYFYHENMSKQFNGPPRFWDDQRNGRIQPRNNRHSEGGHKHSQSSHFDHKTHEARFNRQGTIHRQQFPSYGPEDLNNRREGFDFNRPLTLASYSGTAQGGICSTRAEYAARPTEIHNGTLSNYSPEEVSRAIEWLKLNDGRAIQQNFSAVHEQRDGDLPRTQHQQPYYSTPLEYATCQASQGPVTYNQHTQQPPGPSYANYNAQQDNQNKSHCRSFNHVKAMSVPKYSGPAEAKTPYDFLIELEKYRLITGTHEEVMLREVIPVALEGHAYTWYRFESKNQNFRDWEDFSCRFRREFQVLGYEHELSRELESRTQSPKEPLTAYIRVILEYFDRIGTQPSEEEVIKRVKRGMHPEYLQILQGRPVRSIKELMSAAVEAQEVIKQLRTYRPPPSGLAVEPTLQWRQIDLENGNYRNEGRFSQVGPEIVNPRLHPHAIDPYAYYHAEGQRKSVKFSDTGYGPGSERVVRSNSPNTYRGSHEQVRSPNRPQTPPVSSRRCYNCNSEDHVRSNCPALLSAVPGNGQDPGCPIRK